MNLFLTHGQKVENLETALLITKSNLVFICSALICFELTFFRFSSVLISFTTLIFFPTESISWNEVSPFIIAKGIPGNHPPVPRSKIVAPFWNEINLYIELGRTSELITKLGEAIELDPNNSLLYFNRGTIYDQEGNLANAENDYLKAIEIDPSSFGSNYNLGALFFNKAVELNNSANSTSDNNKYKKLKKQANEFFNKALPYLESASSLNPKDKNTLLSLKQLYYMKGDYKKSDEMKKLISEL